MIDWNLVLTCLAFTAVLIGLAVAFAICAGVMLWVGEKIKKMIWKEEEDDDEK